MKYQVIVNDKEITYGPYTQYSGYSDEEWMAIYRRIVEVNQPDLFLAQKSEDDFIRLVGYSIDLEERYEALLNELPQSSFSKAGTHPEWVAEEVNRNIYLREITQDDVKDMINNCENLEDLKRELRDYFEIEVE